MWLACRASASICASWGWTKYASESAELLLRNHSSSRSPGGTSSGPVELSNSLQRRVRVGRYTPQVEHIAENAQLGLPLRERLSFVPEPVQLLVFNCPIRKVWAVEQTESIRERDNAIRRRGSFCELPDKVRLVERRPCLHRL